MVFLDRVRRGFRGTVLGDLNGWIGDKQRDGLTGAFRVVGENEDGREVTDFSGDWGMCVSNIYFYHKNTYNHTRVVLCTDGTEVKSMIDFILVKKYMLKSVMDVKLLRGLGMWVSNVVLGMIKLVEVRIEKKEKWSKWGELRAKS